jgi:hypothetical protein
MKTALEADAVLFGSVGGPKWDNVEFSKKPERGLLRLRKDMGLFANLRPAIVFDALAEASSLKTELVRGLDIMILRELTGGVYFGEPRGIETLPDGSRRGVNTQVYTTAEIVRVARVGFELARKRGRKVCSVEKANVMESGVLWRDSAMPGHRRRPSHGPTIAPAAGAPARRSSSSSRTIVRRPAPLRRHADRLARHAAAASPALPMPPGAGVRSMSRSTARPQSPARTRQSPHGAEPRHDAALPFDQEEGGGGKAVDRSWPGLAVADHDAGGRSHDRRGRALAGSTARD